jgi:hypothetical protein
MPIVYYFTVINDALLDFIQILRSGLTSQYVTYGSANPISLTIPPLDGGTAD